MTAFVKRIDSTSIYDDDPEWIIAVIRGSRGRLYEASIPNPADVPADIRAALIAWAIQPGDLTTQKENQQ